MDYLEFSLPRGLKTENAGLFISPGHGIHATRSIASYEMIFVRSGCLGIEEEGQAYEVRAGEALLLWPGRQHRGTAVYAADLSFYWVHFHLPKGAGKGSRLRIPQYARVARPGRMSELFHRLLDDQESEIPSAEEMALQLTLLLLEFQRRESTAGNEPGHSLAGRAERFIAEAFHRGIQAGDVAVALKCNPDYLGRVYRRAHGCTVSEAIHRRQLQEARALLREGAHNIEEVARACGFRESRYFRKLFTDRQGISPRDYRKLHARAYVNTR